MDKLFRSKWFVLVVSLAFAIALFVFVNVEADKTDNEPSIFPGKSEEMQTLNDVPVGIRIDNEKYVVSGVPESVAVTFKGSSGVLTPTVRQRNFDVFVDLEGLGEGEHEVEVQHANISDDLSVYIEPKTVDVTIEEKATQEFPVTVDFINTENMAAGFELGDYQVDPSEITVTSSKSVIDQIGVVKVFVDVTDVDQAINKREVPVNVYDTQGNELNVNVEPENVLVSADVDNPSKKVSVNVPTKGDLPDGYELTSISPEVDEVEVYARNSVLSELDEISTEEVDLSDVKESGEVKTSLDLPDGATAPDEEEIGVSIEIEQTKKIKNVPIEVKNLPDDQNISYVEPDKPEMDITVDGDEEGIDKLSADDFTVEIDADSLVPGEHTVPVSIKGPEDRKVTGEFEEVTIEVD